MPTMRDVYPFKQQTLMPYFSPFYWEAGAVASSLGGALDVEATFVFFLGLSLGLGAGAVASSLMSILSLPLGTRGISKVNVFFHSLPLV
ncbi:hypothetical protein HAX54_022090 [Datura stramonium]|uniref:Uncharacterized protein n=1 Tax=Datura stramonium TaxID=4076 RepID=A0ABS8UVL1_DATST|nr:hypothetical protein [Datura stramonium]